METLPLRIWECHASRVMMARKDRQGGALAHVVGFHSLNSRKSLQQIRISRP